MKNKTLSICIPTYNRAKYIDELLNSIENQITIENKNQIEICISDNCSTDNTDDIISKYKEKDMCDITYNKNVENVGADKNYLAVVDIANGEYCWWIGSDDVLEKDILTKLIEKIELTNYDFYMLTQNCYDNKIQTQYKCNHHPLLNNSNDTLLSLNDIITEAIYLLGYLSVLIVKREVFIQKMPDEEKYIGSMYVHTYKILYALNNNSTMFYIREPFVKWRGDNDSFLDDLKLFGRIKIDIIGYSSIAADVFGVNSKEYRKIVKVRVINKMLRHILLLKLNKIPSQQIISLYDCIKPYPIYYSLAYLLSLVPSSMALFARKIYRKTFKVY